jgi:hypothetical protein
VLGRIKVGGGEPPKESQAAGAAISDTALSSLLHILVDRLGADIVMVILLDEEMQFFLAIVGQDNSEPAIESWVAYIEPFELASWLRDFRENLRSCRSS